MVSIAEMIDSHDTACPSLVALHGDSYKEANVQEMATCENVPNVGLEDVYDERIQARLLFTPAEEKKLLRRIDWHLMPLCSLIFMFKNLDSNNVRITDTKQNAVLQAWKAVLSTDIVDQRSPMHE